jgi:hypothetical protein
MHLTGKVLLILFSFLKVIDAGVQNCGDFDYAEKFSYKFQHPNGRYCFYQMLLH